MTVSICQRASSWSDGNEEWLLIKLLLYASTLYTSSQVSFPICPWARWVLAEDTFCSTSSIHFPSGHSPCFSFGERPLPHSQSDLQELCPLHQDLGGQGTEAGASTYSTHYREWVQKVLTAKGSLSFGLVSSVIATQPPPKEPACTEGTTEKRSEQWRQKSNTSVDLCTWPRLKSVCPQTF